MFIYETRKIFVQQEGEDAVQAKGVVFAATENQMPAEVGDDILLIPAEGGVVIEATVVEDPVEDEEG